MSCFFTRLFRQFVLLYISWGPFQTQVPFFRSVISEISVRYLAGHVADVLLWIRSRWIRKLFGDIIFGFSATYALGRDHCHKWCNIDEVQTLRLQGCWSSVSLAVLWSINTNLKTCFNRVALIWFCSCTAHRGPSLSFAGHFLQRGSI